MALAVMAHHGGKILSDKQQMDLMRRDVERMNLRGGLRRWTAGVT
jgi:hypothetical protein